MTSQLSRNSTKIELVTLQRARVKSRPLCLITATMRQANISQNRSRILDTAIFQVVLSRGNWNEMLNMRLSNSDLGIAEIAGRHPVSGIASPYIHNSEPLCGEISQPSTTTNRCETPIFTRSCWVRQAPCFRTRSNGFTVTLVIRSLIITTMFSILFYPIFALPIKLLAIACMIASAARAPSLLVALLTNFLAFADSGVNFPLSTSIVEHALSTSSGPAVVLPVERIQWQLAATVTAAILHHAVIVLHGLEVPDGAS